MKCLRGAKTFSGAKWRKARAARDTAELPKGPHRKTDFTRPSPRRTGVGMAKAETGAIGELPKIPNCCMIDSGCLSTGWDRGQTRGMGNCRVS